MQLELSLVTWPSRLLLRGGGVTSRVLLVTFNRTGGSWEVHTCLVLLWKASRPVAPTHKCVLSGTEENSTQRRLKSLQSTPPGSALRQDSMRFYMLVPPYYATNACFVFCVPNELLKFYILLFVLAGSCSGSCSGSSPWSASTFVKLSKDSGFLMSTNVVCLIRWDNYVSRMLVHIWVHVLANVMTCHGGHRPAGELELTEWPRRFSGFLNSKIEIEHPLLVEMSTVAVWCIL